MVNVDGPRRYIYHSKRIFEGFRMIYNTSESVQNCLHSMRMTVGGDEEDS